VGFVCGRGLCPVAWVGAGVLTAESAAARDPFEPLVSPSTAAAWEKELLQDPKVSVPSGSPPRGEHTRADAAAQNRLALSALTKASSHDILLSQAASITTPHLFNVVIPIAGAPITNQRSSGRCWLFAATNVFRVALMRAYKIEEFELSQAYLFYWDKLEKANWFLAQIVETADEELGSRVVQELIGRAVSDGGQWDMVANLVKKYGLVGVQLETCAATPCPPPDPADPIAVRSPKPSTPTPSTPRTPVP
jgi:hypothetical protein